MIFWNRLLHCACMLGIGVVLGGCVPSGSSQLAEEKEPHFVLGKSRVNAMDYTGAIEAFQESLEANPRSASAHFELAWLDDEKESDPAAAIYHYQEFLKLRPESDSAEVIQQRIYRCKQQLAAAVLPLPSTPAAQHELEQLADENRQLHAELDKWRAYYTSEMAARTNSAFTPNIVTTPTGTASTPTQPAKNDSAPPRVVNPDRPANTAARPAKPRTYTVAYGETAVRIARKCGVTLNQLLEANPGLDPRHMRVGLVLNIPSP